jgi:predicted RNA-binding Zn-ribbon protein involved in translation (DUF1610 family)
MTDENLKPPGSVSSADPQREFRETWRRQLQQMPQGPLPPWQGRREERRLWRQMSPRDRIFGEMRLGQAGTWPRGRVGLQTCPKCDGTFAFARMVDEGSGDVMFHCPMCGAEVRRIKREDWVARREQGQRWLDRMQRAHRVGGRWAPGWRDADQLASPAPGWQQAESETPERAQCDAAPPAPKREGRIAKLMRRLRRKSSIAPSADLGDSDER